MFNSFTEKTNSALAHWSSTSSYLLLTALTLLCLLPFSGRAFHVDDPLFIWSAQQIVKHPLDPYGFQVLWDSYSEPMSEVTKNPPLTCYYAAIIGSIAGWSERALHLGFLLPALALVLGTYRLSLRFTRSPLIAAAATLLTPAVLVSASSVMCDVMMLAFWIWATVLWIEGLDRDRPLYFAASALLISCAVLTKYFAICLLPLLFLYSAIRKRRLGWWALYLAVPVALLFGYQLWTAIEYGHAMFSQAMDFSHAEQGVHGRVSPVANALVCASFVGGCTLSVLLLAPFIWRWQELVVGLLSAGLFTLVLERGWFGLGHYARVIQDAFRDDWIASGIQLSIAIAAGIAVLALGFSAVRNWRDANSVFLGIWLVGTFVFAAFLNWSVNARSVMPLIPAAGILLARRLDQLQLDATLAPQRRIALALMLSGVVSLWVTKADSDWANSARQAAELIHQRTLNAAGTVWFEGHWGFQYYMQLWGAPPLDFLRSHTTAGDLLIVPESNAVSYPLPSSQFIASSGLLQIELPQPVSTMRWRRGAGFYSSFYGFLPFAFGTPAKEQYYLLTLATTLKTRLIRTPQN